MYTDFVEQNPHKSMFLIDLFSNRNDQLFHPIFRNFMEESIGAVEKVIFTILSPIPFQSWHAGFVNFRLYAFFFLCK